MQPRYPYQKRPREKNPAIKANAPYTPDISTERDAMLCVPILTAENRKGLGNMQVYAVTLALKRTAKKRKLIKLFLSPAEKPTRVVVQRARLQREQIGGVTNGKVAA